MIKINEENKKELIGQIIDIFEDFSTGEGLTSSEEAFITGERYDEMAENIIYLIEEKKDDEKFNESDIESIIDSFKEIVPDEFAILEDAETSIRGKITETFLNWNLIDNLFYITYKVDGRYTIAVNAANLQEAFEKASDDWLGADLGKLEVISAKPIICRTKWRNNMGSISFPLKGENKMKNVRKDKKKTCIFLETAELYRIFKEIFEYPVIIDIDYEGISFENEDGDSIPDEVIFKKLEEYFDISQITSIHIDNCDVTGIWIVYKDKEECPEAISVSLYDSEYPEYNERYLISSEFLTNEIIELISRISEEWYNLTLTNDEIRILDKDIDESRIITSDGDVEVNASEYHEISCILSKMESQSLNKKVKITGCSIKFIG